MPRVKLAAKKMASLTATGGQTDYFDSGANVPGFGLRVSAGGRRVWFLLYRDSLRRLQRYTIGTNPPMGLDKARTMAREKWLEVQVKDADPAAERRARRSALTFEQLADKFIEDYAKPHKRTWRDDARQLRSMCAPKWGQRPATEITRTDVRELLGDVSRNRGGTTANRLRSCLSKLFRWAVAQDYLPANPASDLPKLVRETPRERVLSDDEIRTLWARLDAAETRWRETEGEEGMPAAVTLWLRLRLYTGQRGAAVAKMRWANVDLEQGVWDIPAADMKGRCPHVVPLSPAVVELLKKRRAVTGEKATYVLQGGRSRRLRLGVIETIGLEDFEPRDLRRTAATGMARAGVLRFIIARVLGHVDRSITGIYDRFEYLNEKRVALDTWARRLAAILEGQDAGKVVAFGR